jgi:ornithine cyclodeaminase/alanine dehydrogenase-like protein (mu-crystallin family)
MLVISNEEVRQLLTMKDCMAVLEEAYMERHHQRALSRPRTDLYSKIDDETYYVFKSMEGVLPKRKVTALRLNSDVIKWNKTPHGIRKDKQPLADGRWVGLIALFDMTNGKMLAILPDGVVQGFRVAATGGLGIKYLARPDAKTMGLYGAGWQAETQVISACEARRLDYVKVYSPTRAKREEFAQRLSQRVGIPVIAVDRPEEAAIGLDIVAATTNSITQVIKPDWISPGTHVSCVKHLELGDDVIAKADFVAVHSHRTTPENYMIGQGETRIEGQDPNEKGAHQVSDIGWESSPELHTIMGGGAAGRTDSKQITCFVNNIGLGLQFAAVGALILDKANERGLGIRLPDGWFTEDVHP